jgi:phospholipid-binding lipoprotein MlaA
VGISSLTGAEADADAGTAVKAGSSAKAGAGAEPAAGTSGTAPAGLPQTSQYPSTIVPVHPACVQAEMRPLRDLAETPNPRPTGICPASTADAGDTAEAAAPSGANGTAPAGLPQTSQ